MKPKGVIRSVQLQRQNRSLGDAPSIGRVAKMSPSDAIRQRRSKQEHNSLSRPQKENRFVINLWSWILCVGSIGLLGGISWLVLARNFDKARGVGYKEPEVVERSISQNALVESLVEEDAIAFVKSALAIRDPADVPNYFRIGENDANSVVSFLSSMESREGKIQKVKWRGNNSLGRVAMDELIVNFKGDEMLKNRVVLLIPDETGKWKIDYDAFARTIKPSWDELIKGQASVGEVRVIASIDNYYNGPFSNEEEWICYSFLSPDADEVFRGYCKIGSAQADAMKQVLSDKKVARVTLEISRVKDGGQRQFEISRVLSSDWAKGDVAFDEAF
jgi:hypothetical protein